MTALNENEHAAIAIYQLGYKAGEIYEKASPDEKRLLLSEIFTNLIQDAYTIRPKYSLAGKYLSDWAPKLNSDYELQKNVTPPRKKKGFGPFFSQLAGVEG
jgi:hypothetical protein